MNYIWNKLFNKKKYTEYKYKKKQKIKLDFYNSVIKIKLDKIDKSLANNKDLSFSHSGHLGDLIYSLPLIKELSKKLGISVTSLYRLRQKGIIKHIRVGGRVLFEYDIVLKSLKEQSNYGGVL